MNGLVRYDHTEQRYGAHGNVARVERSQRSVEFLGRREGRGECGRGTRMQLERALAELDRCRVRNERDGPRVVELAALLERERGPCRDVREVQSDRLLASVGDLDSMNGVEVPSVVQKQVTLLIRAKSRSAMADRQAKDVRATPPQTS